MHVLAPTTCLAAAAAAADSSGFTTRTVRLQFLTPDIPVVLLIFFNSTSTCE